MQTFYNGKNLLNKASCSENNPFKTSIIETNIGKYNLLLIILDNELEDIKMNAINYHSYIYQKILTKYNENAFNNISSLSDALVNLAVIIQISNPLSQSAINMLIMALLIDPKNSVANINYNNYLRETNYKCLSDEFIRQKIYYECFEEQLHLYNRDTNFITEYDSILDDYINANSYKQSPHGNSFNYRKKLIYKKYLLFA